MSGNRLEKIFYSSIVWYICNFMIGTTMAAVTVLFWSSVVRFNVYRYQSITGAVLVSIFTVILPLILPLILYNTIRYKNISSKGVEINIVMYITWIVVLNFIQIILCIILYLAVFRLDKKEDLQLSSSKMITYDSMLIR